MGVQIPVLGALSGTLNLAVFVGDDAGCRRPDPADARQWRDPGPHALRPVPARDQHVLDDARPSRPSWSSSAPSTTPTSTRRASRRPHLQVFNGLAHDAAGPPGRSATPTSAPASTCCWPAPSRSVTRSPSMRRRRSSSSPTELTWSSTAPWPSGRSAPSRWSTPASRSAAAGLVANVDIRLGASFGASLGLKFNASVLLQLNTTGQVRQMCIRTGTTGCSDRSGATTNATDIAPGFLLDIRGSVTIAFIKGSGFVRIRVGCGRLRDAARGRLRYRRPGLRRPRCGRGVRRRDRRYAWLCTRSPTRPSSASTPAAASRSTPPPRHVSGSRRASCSGISGKVSILKVLNFDANVLIEYKNAATTAGGWTWHLHADASRRLLRPGQPLAAASTSTTTATSTSSCTAGWCSAATTTAWSATSTSR